jgi:potassium efflux system protein
MLICWIGGAQAADQSSSVNEDTLKALIAEVEATADVDEKLKSRLTELYRKSLTNLEKRNSNEARTKAYQEALQSAPGEAQTIRTELDERRQTSATNRLQVSEQTPLSEIEQLLIKEQANRTAVQAKLSDLEQQISEESNRPTAARDRISKAAKRRDAITDELRMPAPTDQPNKVSEAKKWSLQSEDAALASEIKMIDQELLSQPARLDLLKAKRDREALSLERIDARLQLLETLLGGKRLADAQRAIAEARDAQRQAIGKHQLVRELAAQNASLSEEVGTEAGRLEQIANAETDASQKAKRLAEELRNTQQKVEVAGMSQALGRVLLEQRRRLPNVRVFRAQAEEREETISEVSLSQIQHEEERRKLRNLDDYVDELVADLPHSEADAIRDELRTLAKNRKQLLDKAIDTEQTLLRSLGELDFAQRKLLETVESYTQFLAERLLWIRSSPPPSLEMLRDMPAQAIDLLSPVAWFEVLKSLGGRALRSPVLTVTLAVFGLLLWRSRPLRRALQRTGQDVGKVRSDTYVTTLQALGLTLLMAAPWPLLMAVIGWQLATAVDATVFSKSVGGALIWVANAYFYLESFRLLCYPRGLAESHFCWPEPALRTLRRSLVRLMAVFLPAAFVGNTIITIDTPSMGGGIGRICFVLVLLAIGLFFYRLFHPGNGVLAPVMARHPKSPLTRLRHLWLGLGVALPLALAVLGVAGYLYTAGTLTGTLIDTMWFVLVLVVIHQMAVRWLLLVHRRLVYQAALKKRDAARAAAESPPTPGGDELPEVEMEPLDLDSLSQDSRKLLSTALDIVGIIGIWLIWSPVLPAFAVMDHITLWNYLSTADGQETRIPVTVADAGLALLMLTVTVVATKRFPALLEIGLLQRITMTPGGRYAAITLARYSIAALGTVFVFGILGVSWSQIQWLVAALGVGIGFGLQEIVANFISGLIILFERPIRVGDTVTVADTSGVVTKIRIRATTIRNWDGQELLVPNKEFITSRLLNWTLSDPVNRLVLPVGLAYGGDVGKAMSLMVEAAAEHPNILAEPQPWVSFDEFGDNALTLKLRCFVPSMENRLATFSALHEAINRKFNEAGLVIAFPQRDVHLDTSQPLDVRIHKDQGHADPA